MLLTVVGNTGSFPGPDAPASCYLLSGEDADGRTWRIVLDMGNGTLGALQRHIELETIDAIMLSHLHPDHCVDVGGLHVAIKWDPRGWTAGPIPLFGPSQLPTYLNQLHLLPPEHSMDTEFEFHVWQPLRSVTVGPFTVTPFPVNHPCPEPYALRVEYRGPSGTEVLTYSGTRTRATSSWTRHGTRTSSCARRPTRRGARTGCVASTSPAGARGRRPWPRELGGCCSPTCPSGTPRRPWRPRRPGCTTARWR